MKYLPYVLVIIVGTFFIFFFAMSSTSDQSLQYAEPAPSTSSLPIARTVSSVPALGNFYGFNGNFVLEDQSKMSSSTNVFWWLSSGGAFIVDRNIGSTFSGDLPLHSKWQKIYAGDNARDTDNGLHPQNIFRLVLRSVWSNYEQQAYFLVKKINLSSSSFRNQSNGLMLFNLYKDSENLYYAGLRVDGYVEIKKKERGVYHTMVYKDFLHKPGYDRFRNPNNIPLNKWIGVKTVVTKTSRNSIYIRLLIDNGGGWVLAAEAVDDGKSFGGPVIGSSGRLGIRTDFMDVDIRDYMVKNA